MPRTRDEWVAREMEAAKPIGPDRPHPDYCPKLLLAGAEWSLPPRGGVVPVFHGDSVQLCGGSGEWEALVEKVLAAAPIDNGERCPTCGTPIKPEITASLPWMADVFALAACALRSRYDLTDGELSELLAIRGGRAEWVAQLMTWCVG